MTTRTIKIAGREVTLAKADLPEVARNASGRAKTFTRQVIEALRPGEVSPPLPYGRTVFNAAKNAGEATGKVFAVRKEGTNARVYCTGKRKSNVLVLRKSQIAA